MSCFGSSKEQPLINTYLESGRMLIACESFLGGSLLSAKDLGPKWLWVPILCNHHIHRQGEVTGCVEIRMMKESLTVRNV